MGNDAVFQHHLAWIVAAVAVVLLVLYRRGRRWFGRQRYRETRLRWRVGILALVCALLLAQAGALRESALLAEIAGAIIGAAIALAALHWTTMNQDEDGIWYVPHTYFGLGLLALLVGRLVYKFAVVLPQIQQAARKAAANGVHPNVVTMQPISHAILFLVLGYYFAYYIGLMYFAGRLTRCAVR